MKQNNKKILMGVGIGIVVWLVVMVVAGVILFNSSVARLNRQLNLANKYLSEDNWEEAVIAFKAAIEIEPECVDAYVGLEKAASGRLDVLMDEDRYEEAYAFANEIAIILEAGYQRTQSDAIENASSDIRIRIETILLYKDKENSLPDESYDDTSLNDTVNDDSPVEQAQEDASDVAITEEERLEIYEDYCRRKFSEYDYKTMYYDLTHDGFSNLVATTRTKSVDYPLYTFRVYDLNDDGEVREIYYNSGGLDHVSGFLYGGIYYEDGEYYISEKTEGMWQGAGWLDYKVFYIDAKNSNHVEEAGSYHDTGQIVKYNGEFGADDTSDNWTETQENEFDAYKKEEEHMWSMTDVIVDTFREEGVWW